jgi:hypothetical protein
MQTIERFGFDIELLVIAGAYNFTIRELPVEWNNADGSTVQPIDYVRTFNELLYILWNKYTGRYGGITREESKLKHFTESELAEHGRGFHYNGKRFVHHSDLHHAETALYSFTHKQIVFMATALVFLLLSLVFNWHSRSSRFLRTYHSLFHRFAVQRASHL